MLFELKGLGGPTGTIGLTPNEKRIAEDRRDCYWLYIVTDCDSTPRPQIIRDPANLPWHEGKKVDHYWLGVDAMTRSMVARDAEAPYGKGEGRTL